jgi:hypothetical protein
MVCNGEFGAPIVPSSLTQLSILGGVFEKVRGRDLRISQESDRFPPGENPQKCLS